MVWWILDGVYEFGEVVDGELVEGCLGGVIHFGFEFDEFFFHALQLVPFFHEFFFQL